MAPKINQITTAQNRPGVMWEAAFRLTLGNGVRYVASTWHNYLSAWRALGTVEQERLVELGAAEGGEWMPVVTNWLKSDAAKRGAKKARTGS
ncbi:hypothetical protein FRC05_007658 [Tulasnella sp. 425]|nr:hypothetical protein FRC05_007658 [Tulasnella sp. 425]